MLYKTSELFLMFYVASLLVFMLCSVISVTKPRAVVVVFLVLEVQRGGRKRTAPEQPQSARKAPRVPAGETDAREQGSASVPDLSALEAAWRIKFQKYWSYFVERH